MNKTGFMSTSFSAVPQSEEEADLFEATITASRPGAKGSFWGKVSGWVVSAVDGMKGYISLKG